MNNDSLPRELSALSVDAPDTLINSIAARWLYLPTPVGEAFVAYTDHGVVFVRKADGAFDAFRSRLDRPLRPALEAPRELPAALFGEATVDVDLRASTRFQTDVLLAVRSIPKGEVRSYGWIAREIGRPKAVRAVGTALATNPVPLVVPCHRVVRSDGQWGQYIFGSQTKHTLLHHEADESTGTVT